MAKAPPCPERTLKRRCRSKVSPLSSDEEGRWVSMEDRRRRRAVFEKTAKRMLKYIEDSDDVKVGVTELHEQFEMSEEAGIPIKQVAP